MSKFTRCAPVVGIEFTIERERRLVPVVETNCWEFRGCFPFREFQHDLEEPKEMRRRNARARLFVVHEAGVKSDGI
jgi:hypothetical protein